MFGSLSDRLSETFKGLRGKGRLSEADIDATVKEIRTALLDHLVVFFRDQNLTSAQFMDLASRFGASCP